MLGVSLGLAAALLLHADEPPGSTTPATALEAELPTAPVQKYEPLSVNLSARIEYRAGQPEGTVNTHLGEIEVDPAVGLRIPFRGGSATVAYEPRLFIVVHETPPQPDGRKTSWLNRVRLALEDSPSPTWRLYLNGRFAFGDNDFLPLNTVIGPTPGTSQPPNSPGTTPVAPTPNPGPGTLPDTRFLPIVDVDVSAGFVHALGPAWNWQLTAGYIYSGGSTEAARQSLPLQQGPVALTGVQWQTSPRDALGFRLDGSYLRFSSVPNNVGPRTTVVNLTGVWTHSFNRNAGSDLIAGVGGFHANIPPVTVSGQPEVPGQVQTSALPVGGLGLRYNVLGRGFAWRNSLVFLAAPLPDRISGVVQERLSAGLRSSLSPVEGLFIDLTGGASATLAGVQRDARLEGRVSYQFIPEFGISLGGRVAWLEGSTLLGTNGFGWVAFVSLGSYAGATLFGLPQ